jgi:hypothetical protein
MSIELRSIGKGWHASIPGAAHPFSGTGSTPESAINSLHKELLGMEQSLYGNEARRLLVKHKKSWARSKRRKRAYSKRKRGY